MAILKALKPKTGVSGLELQGDDSSAEKISRLATSKTTSAQQLPRPSWRDVLPIHPAAELFPLMSEVELRELADDIEKNGLCDPVAIYDGELLDGRNRLDALALLGRDVCNAYGRPVDYCQVGHEGPFDPFAYVVSKNLQRRHLTQEQKRDLIAKVLKAKPEASNREIARDVKADDKTVAKVRDELESTAEIPQLKKTTGRDGKKRPTHKATAPTPAPTWEPPATATPVEAETTEAAATPARLIDQLPFRPEPPRDWNSLADELCAWAADLAKRDPALARSRVAELIARLQAATKNIDEGTLPQHAAAMLADGLPAAFIRPAKQVEGKQ
jgi:hypothetical protein